MDAQTPLRRRLFDALADLVPQPSTNDCVRVAVDGVDGSGKTMLADELAETLRCRGRPVVRVSIDDFHHVRAIRYKRGRHSPQGYWLDSFDYDRFRADVLDPLGPGGSRVYRPVAHDLATDEPLDPEPRAAVAGAVLVVDGVFLLRDELATAWDFSIFLDVPFEVTVARMTRRDGTDPDPSSPLVRRWVGGQRLYLAACRPQQRASMVVDNTVIDAPRIVRPTDPQG